MADFYPVLSKAISGLKEQSPQARRAIYDRARQVLVAQLRNVNPPMSETEITRQRLALDDVINRIEAEQAEAAMATDVAEPAAVPAPEPLVPFAPAAAPEPAKAARPSFASLLPAGLRVACRAAA
jgi:hypothetical protein